MEVLTPLTAKDVPRSLTGWSVLSIGIMSGFHLYLDSIRFTSEPRMEKDWDEPMADSMTKRLCESERDVLTSPFALLTAAWRMSVEEESGNKPHFLRKNLSRLGLSEPVVGVVRCFADTVKNLRTLTSLVTNNQARAYCETVGLDPIKVGAQYRTHGQRLDAAIMGQKFTPKEN